MNFTDQMNDVHDPRPFLGGNFGAPTGMHFTLSAERQSALSLHTGLALAEVPSTFAELLTLRSSARDRSRPETRRALICERVEGSFATVFRQTVLTRYEQRAYAAPARDNAHRRPSFGDLARRQPHVLRGDRRAARRLPIRVELHSPFHLHALLHLRIRVLRI